MSKNYYEVLGISKDATLYEVLGVSKDATLKEIKTAYIKRGKKFHPDNNTFENATIAHFIMCLLNDAYSTLRDSEKRMQYDKRLEEEHKNKEKNQNDDPSPSHSKESKTFRSNTFYDYKKFNEDDFDYDEQEYFISYNKEFIESFIQYYFNKVKNIKEKDNLLDLYLKLYKFIDIEEEYYTVYSISKTPKRNLFK